MEIIFFLLIGVFVLLGIGSFNSGSQFKPWNIALILAGTSYIGGALIAVTLDSWWPLLVCFLLTYLIRFIWGDPGKI